jgi:hypothetical protein
MKTPDNFRQLKLKLSKEQLIEVCDQEVSDALLKLLQARDAISRLEKEIEESNRDRDKYAAMVGIKPKSPNAIRQAKYRQRKKEQTKDTL